jgi:two-component system, sensor histidine kinase
MTAYAMGGERQECLSAGCDEYLAKPFNVVLLMEVFNKYLSDGVTDVFA